MATAPPAQPASPAAKPPTTGGSMFKKIPMPVWLAMGGATLGLGYALIRDRSKGPATTPAEGAEVPEDQLSYQPSPVPAVGNVPVGVSEPAETVGAIGQTALETSLKSMTDIITALLTREYNPNTPGVGATQAFPEAPPPPPAAPPPPPVSRPNKPAHYTAFNGTLSMPIYSSKWKQAGGTTKRFPGATGYALIFKDMGSGVAGYHIAFSNHVLQRWHVDFLGAHRGRWVKHWQGRWG